MRQVRFVLAAALSIGIASTAFARTEEELLEDASALLEPSADTRDAVFACENGECPEAVQIDARFEALVADRQRLQAERNELVGCDCAALDRVLADVKNIQLDTQVVIVTWEMNQ